jgi:hypothetical protein
VAQQSVGPPPIPLGHGLKIMATHRP